MPRKNKSRYALLGLLGWAPMSGYDIKKISDHSIGHFWNENYGNIYPVLRKMQDEGLVSMIRQEQSDAPARKVYTITEKGRQEFEAWMHSPPDRGRLRDELLLQVFFGSSIGPESIMSKLEDEEQRCSAQIRDLEEIREHMVSGSRPEEAESPAEQAIRETGRPYWKSTVEFGLSYYRNIRRWCRDTIAEFEQRNGEPGPSGPESGEE